MKRIAQFALATGAIAVAGALVLSRMFSEPRATTAVWISAAATVVVQLATFAVARRYAQQGEIMTGWGVGALARVTALALYGFLAPRSFGLPLTPALLSFALFVFVSTIIEPLFLAK